MFRFFSNSRFIELSKGKPSSDLFLIISKRTFISRIVILNPCPAKG